MGLAVVVGKSCHYPHYTLHYMRMQGVQVVLWMFCNKSEPCMVVR